MVTMTVSRWWVAGLLLGGWLCLSSTALAQTEGSLAELQQELAERDAEIEQLREQLQALRGDSPATSPVSHSSASESTWNSSPPEFITPGSEEPVYIPPAECYTDGCEAPREEGLLDNFSLFFGLEGSKQPQDFGVNANFGGRAAFNWGVPLSRELGLGVQIGSSINYTDNAVRVLEPVVGNRDRTQVYTTVGIFQRLDNGFKWAVGYDFLYQNYYDHFHLGQWRGRFGYDLNRTNEIGVLVNISERADRGTIGAVNVRLDPITQGNVYWRHTWATQAETTFWLGVAEGHSEANLALGDNPPRDEVLVFGADVHLPLNDYVAIFGQANFLMPADTGTVDAFLGFEIYLDGGAMTARRNQFAPLLPVANNTTFATDLTRQ